jgi:hypothetical protein
VSGEHGTGYGALCGALRLVCEGTGEGLGFLDVCVCSSCSIPFREILRAGRSSTRGLSLLLTLPRPLVPCVAGTIGVGAGSGVRAADTSAHDLSGADADAWGGDELDLGFDSE